MNTIELHVIVTSSSHLCSPLPLLFVTRSPVNSGPAVHSVSNGCPHGVFTLPLHLTSTPICLPALSIHSPHGSGLLPASLAAQCSTVFISFIRGGSVESQGHSQSIQVSPFTYQHTCDPLFFFYQMLDLNSNQMAFFSDNYKNSKNSKEFERIFTTYHF